MATLRARLYRHALRHLGAWCPVLVTAALLVGGPGAGLVALGVLTLLIAGLSLALLTET